MFQEYEAILNKQDPLIIEREQKEKRVIDYFMHSMQTPRDCTVEEEIYMGIFDDGTVNMHEVQECTESLMIANPGQLPCREMAFAVRSGALLVFVNSSSCFLSRFARLQILRHRHPGGCRPVDRTFHLRLFFRRRGKRLTSCSTHL